jgi:regulator of RNase E activity RraA
MDTEARESVSGDDRSGPGSGDVSDVCDELGVDAFRTGVLRPAWPGVPPVAGLLATIRLEPAEDARSPLPELLELLAGARDAVLLIDLAGRADCQCWGSVLATAAKRLGVRGVLVNGSVRDVDDLRGLDFPTFARGVYPGAMRGRLRIAATGEPVEVDGASVTPGCFAVADASGLVAFAASRADEVLALAARRRTREQALLEAIEAGADPRDILLAPQVTEEGER